MSNESVSFGFEQVTPSEKDQKVQQVFSDVAPCYDRMNDLMSLGLHRLWKRDFVRSLHLAPHHNVLDVASGTGDVALLLAKRVPRGKVWMLDRNEAMLRRGRARMVDAGYWDRSGAVLADAACMPLCDGSVDQITMAFGLRNMTCIPQVLSECYRVLKPGGCLSVLEFSKPKPWLQPAYSAVSWGVIPVLGRCVGQADHYRYLVESIRRHPDQEALARLLQAAGFERVIYRNLHAGIVACHRGVRLAL